MWQSSLIEPALLPSILEEHYRYSGKVTMDERLAARVLNQHVVRHAAMDNVHEVAWAVWGLMMFDAQLSSRATKAACKMKDPVVATLLLEAHERGKTHAPTFSSDGWEEFSTEDTLFGAHWLLAYEAGCRGIQLGGKRPPKKWSNEGFAKLQSSGVRFLIDEFYQDRFDNDDDDELEDEEEEEDNPYEWWW